MASTSTNSPCAACKFLRRKCTAECVFAPYFPPEEPQKFVNVHKIFGASNVTKLLNDLPPHQREDAVNSLAYEAEARLKDPVYGCVGAISILQRQVFLLQKELAAAQAHLLHVRRYSTATSAAAVISFPRPTQAQSAMSIPLPGRLDILSKMVREQHHHYQNILDFPDSAPPQLSREQIVQLAIRMGMGESGTVSGSGSGSGSDSGSALEMADAVALGLQLQLQGQGQGQMYPFPSTSPSPSPRSGSGSSGGSLGPMSPP